MMASEIWKDYINFVINNYDVGQRNGKLRTIFHRAIKYPMHGIEDFCFS